MHINLNRGPETTEHVLQVAVELGIKILAVQEPWVIDQGNHNYRSINHQGFKQIFPSECTVRPRAMFYVSREIRVSLDLISPQDPDCVIIHITDLDLQVVNIYNAVHPNIPNSTPVIQRPNILPAAIARKSLLVGDFNTHHPWWDPLRAQSSNSDVLTDLIDKFDLCLLNTPGEGTYYRPDMETPSVIDLAFATQGMVDQVTDWQVVPDLGSDHHGLLFTIVNTSTASIPRSYLRFNTKKADWAKFRAHLNLKLEGLVRESYLDLESTLDLDQEELQSFSTDQDLDELAIRFTNSIVQAAENSIPKCKVSVNAKPWWNQELKDLRKIYKKFSRLVKSSGYSLYKEELRQSRNLYFNSIKAEKISHWNSFLEKEDSQSIFKAMSYTKVLNAQPIPSIFDKSSQVLRSEFHQKCDIFRSTLFPMPPSSTAVNLDHYQPNPDWKWPRLSRIELRQACTTKIKGTTPGSDLVVHEIIVQAYLANPEVFFWIYSLFINRGYHPKIWKQAIGVILKKPSKPDYSQPKAYRVISLLSCLGKVPERILAKRLNYLAETTNLLHKSQIGGRLSKSAIDTALLIQTEVEQNKANKLKTSTLFLDVKGAFDHVSKNRLLETLQSLKLPLSLLFWIKSFMEDRVLRLSFDNQSEEFSAIDTGIPQGSPVSPILFLIYIRDLFKSKLVKWYSYMDDISMTAASKSYKKNIVILEREARKLVLLGDKNLIQFDISKTELIHFHNSKLEPSLTMPDKSIVEPKRLVKWLGIHFDNKLRFKEHIGIRTSLAKQSFYRLNRLANISRGLSPFALRQLYLACVTSVSDYGSILWWGKENQSQVRPLQAIQNLASRRILGVFKSAPIIPMELEAALLAPIVRLNHSRRRYALRILKLSKTHPVREEFEKIRQRDLDSDSDLYLESDSEPGSEPREPLQASQIERIYRSIASLVELDSLETIRSFHFPPWEREAPYTVTISKKPKEEESKLHIQYLRSICSKNVRTIYTDGSQTLEGKGIGIGLAVFDHRVPYIPEVPVYSESRNIGPNSIVYNGELGGITRALEYATTMAEQGVKFKVCSDNQAGLLRLRTLSDNPGQDNQIRAIKATKAIRAKGAEVELIWVPGHCDIPGNELADKLAKEATAQLPEADATSFAFLGIRINQLKRQEIRKTLSGLKQSEVQESYRNIYTWKISSKISLPIGTRREQASSFFQLKLGHGYLKSNFHRMRVTHSSNSGR